MKRTIEIDTDDLFFKIFEGTEKEEECSDDENCLALLLADQIVFSNERETTFQGNPSGSTVVLYVCCNDMFAWGCADAELLPHDEIAKLTKMHIADPKWGAMKWCMFRRNQKPQGPVEKDMKRDGSWDKQMEDLPSNTLDATVHSMFKDLAGRAKVAIGL